MINNPFISIIIPAYNAGPSIENCLISVFQQSYSNFEIILINDGSNDDTLSKAINLKNSDNRLKVYNQENCGVSLTRNKGIELASGDFFCYVDADDTVEVNYLKNLVNGIVNEIGNNGLIIQQLNFLDSKGSMLKRYGEPFNNSIITSENFERLFCEFKIIKYGFNCGKLFNLNIVRKNNIKYRHEIIISEDLIFMLDYLYYTDYVHLIEGADYNYVTTTYSLGNIKYATFASEKRLLHEYVLKLKELKNKFHLSDESLKEAYLNSGDILMRLLYSMYRLNNSLPMRKQRIENLKSVVVKNKLLLNMYFPAYTLKEKLSKFLLLYNLFYFFDSFRMVIRIYQKKRLNNL